jgi:hypothetical protein
LSSLALGRPLSRALLVVVGSALAGGLATLAVIGLVRLASGSDHAAASARVYSPPGHAFSIGVPRGWTALSDDRLARVPGSPAAVLRRSDGHGTVIVQRTGDLRGDPRQVARGLTAELTRRMPGFRPIGARVGRIRAGGAFLYTFARGGTAQSLTVTNVHGVTYRIDTVVPAGANDAAREAGATVGSFGP